MFQSDRCANMYETSCMTEQPQPKPKGQPFPDLDASDTYQGESTATTTSAMSVRAKTMENVFFLAASAEYGSEHPLAKGMHDIRKREYLLHRRLTATPIQSQVL